MEMLVGQQYDVPSAMPAGWIGLPARQLAVEQNSATSVRTNSKSGPALGDHFFFPGSRLQDTNCVFGLPKRLKRCFQIDTLVLWEIDRPCFGEYSFTACIWPEITHVHENRGKAVPAPPCRIVVMLQSARRIINPVHVRNVCCSEIVAENLQAITMTLDVPAPKQTFSVRLNESV